MLLLLVESDFKWLKALSRVCGNFHEKWFQNFENQAFKKKVSNPYF